MYRFVCALAASFLFAGPWSAHAQTGCRDVPVGSGSMHTCLTGEGSPTVVLAAGAGQTGRTWSPVVQALGPTFRILTFDRPGLGQSEAGQTPRTPTRIAEELHELLRTLDVDGPLVLVGHSMGGVHMLRYATLFPKGVQAVVLIDTPPPGFEEARMELLNPEEQNERERLLVNALSGGPEVVRLEREAAESREEWQFGGFPGHVPLTVVVADSQDFGTLGSPVEHRHLWISESRQWLALSDSSEFVIAAGSGHMVHHHAPDLVVGIVSGFQTSR